LATRRGEQLRLGLAHRARCRHQPQKKTLFATEQNRPDVACKRQRWKTHQGGLDPARLVFIDETWAKTNMTPLRGWAPC
jgi:hypothetical protein